MKINSKEFIIIYDGTMLRFYLKLLIFEWVWGIKTTRAGQNSRNIYSWLHDGWFMKFRNNCNDFSEKKIFY